MREKDNIAKSSDLDGHIGADWKRAHRIWENICKENSAVVALIPTSGTITLNVSAKTLHYVKIGRVVILTGHLGVDSVSSPSGELKITGLPFLQGNYPPASIYSYMASVSVYANGLAATATTAIQGLIETENGQTKIYLSKFVAGQQADLAGDIIPGTQFQITAIYFI
jgi:hypothetical protein